MRVDDDVAGEGVAVAGDGPGVDVVNVLYAFYGADGGADVVEADVGGGAFHEDVQAVAAGVPAAFADEYGDDEAG